MNGAAATRRKLPNFLCPAPYGNTLRTHRLERLLLRVGDGVGTLMDEPVECLPDTCMARPRKMAIQGLQAGGQFVTLYDADDQLWCTIGANSRFAILAAGKLMMLPAKVVQERLKTNTVDGTLQETAREVFNVLSGLLARELGELTRHPNLAFMREECNDPAHLPEEPLIVSSAKLWMGERDLGFVQLWFSAERVRNW